MKTSIAIIIAASTMVLAGCCTTAHSAKWEYKEIAAPQKNDEALNRLADQGWSIVYVGSSQDGSFYLLKRFKK